MRSTPTAYSALAWLALAACGPRAHVVPLTGPVHGAVDPEDPAARTARTLAPVLYLQRDESFPLLRVVAVVHPSKPIIGYHFLWRDDVHGAWIPFTTATDEEIVWVGYDSTGAPTDVWTYWHAQILHADWRTRGTVEINVQWGKHGSLPRQISPLEEPWPRTLAGFWMATWIGLPDIWLSRLQRKGPWCFCHGLARYYEFTRPILSGARLDAIIRTAEPQQALRSVFGKYSSKRPWP